MEFVLLSEMSLPKDASTVSILFLGFLLGLRHAGDADHLAAVSAIVSERKNLLSSAIVGGMWGVGHTVSLLIIGALMIFLKLQISETAEAYLEAGVGVMLVALGLNVLRKIISGKHMHEHTHGGRAHAHVHQHGGDQTEQSHHFSRFSPRSVVVGMIHGLAGSAAVMLVVLPAIESSAVALLYILIFGVGSIGGMILASFLFGLPVHFTAGSFININRTIRLLAGVFSFGLGLSIIYEKIFVSA